MGYQLAYLDLTLVHSNGQARGHENFRLRIYLKGCQANITLAATFEAGMTLTCRGQ